MFQGRERVDTFHLLIPHSTPRTQPFFVSSSPHTPTSPQRKQPYVMSSAHTLICTLWEGPFVNDRPFITLENRNSNF